MIRRTNDTLFTFAAIVALLGLLVLLLTDTAQPGALLAALIALALLWLALLR